MASTGQRCPLCGEWLLKFLFNPNGDYILNCSSRVCLYGILHARVVPAEQQLPLAAESSPAAAAVAASIIDGAPGTCDVAVPVGSSFGSGAGDGRSAATFNEVSNQVDLFSTFGEMDDKSTINMMDTSRPATTSTAMAVATDSFPESFDFCTETRDDDEDMINQWVRELTGQSADTPASIPSAIIQDQSPVVELPPASPMESMPDLVKELEQLSTPVSLPVPVAVQSKPPAVRSAAKRVPKPLVRTAATSVPVGKKSNPIVKLKPEPKPVAKSTKPKLLTPKSEKPASKLPLRLQKSQAMASLLKSHLGATDDVPSEASSDSGIQSDASSDLSSSSSSLTPIQRLLHIEEAKKRSWGVTGMPGFKPSAAATTKDRKRARPALC